MFAQPVTGAASTGLSPAPLSATSAVQLTKRLVLAELPSFKTHRMRAAEHLS